MNTNRGRIICGFAGIGKSTVAKTNGRWVDLESTPFKKNWKMYVDVIEHMANSGYNVMVSCHEDLRKELMDRKIPFEVIIPDMDDKDEYIERYRKRGNDETFIKNLSDNWYTYIHGILTEWISGLDGERLMSVHILKLGEYLEDYLFSK